MKSVGGRQQIETVIGYWSEMLQGKSVLGAGKQQLYTRTGPQRGYPHVKICLGMQCSAASGSMIPCLLESADELAPGRTAGRDPWLVTMMQPRVLYVGRNQ